MTQIHPNSAIDVTRVSSWDSDILQLEKAETLVKPIAPRDVKAHCCTGSRSQRLRLEESSQEHNSVAVLDPASQIDITSTHPVSSLVQNWMGCLHPLPKLLNW